VFIHACTRSAIRPVLPPEDRLAEARHQLRRTRRRVGCAFRPATHSRRPRRRLHLRAIRGTTEEFGRCHDASHRLADVSICLRKYPGALIDECGRSRCRSRSGAPASRDEPRGRRMARNDVEHVFTIFVRGPRRGCAPIRPFALRRGSRAEDELTVAWIHRPAGQSACDLDDVFLRVPTSRRACATPSARGIVLIEASARRGGAAPAGRWGNRPTPVGIPKRLRAG